MLNSTSRNLDARNSISSWKSRILQNILVGATIAGLIAIPPAIQGSADPIFSALYIGAYILLVGVTFLRLPYGIKSAVLLMLTFALGLSGLLDTSIWGDARTFMMAFVIFASMLLSPRAGWAALALTLAAYAITGWLILNGEYLLPTNEVTPGTLASWLSGATTVALLSIAVMQGVRMLQLEFLRANRESNELLESLLAGQSSLEEKVQTRTHEFEARTILLSSAALVASKISALSNQHDLLDSAVGLIGKYFGHYHVAIYLLDENGEFAFLQASSSQAGKDLVNRVGQFPSQGIGLVETAIQQRRMVIRNDINAGTAQSTNSFASESRSQMVLPLSSQSALIGILDIHSKFPDAFGESEISALQIVADQLALAIENSRLLNESLSIVKQLETDSQNRSRESWGERLSRKTPAFQYTPFGVQEVDEYSTSPGAEPDGLVIPVNLRGQKLGTLRIKRKGNDGNWNEQEQTILHELADQMGLALENARLLEAAQLRAAHERAISEMTAHIGASFDMDTILRTTAQEIGKAIGDAEVAVTLHPEQINKANLSSGGKS